MTDRLVLPIAACFYTLIAAPLVIFIASDGGSLHGSMAQGSMSQSAAQSLAVQSRVDNRIFWPIMTAAAAFLVMQNRSRFKELVVPPHLMCLLAYVCLAGASILWAFEQTSSLTRFAQQVMVVGSIVMPAILATRSSDLMRGLFWCFAIAAVLNLVVIMSLPPPILQKGAPPGLSGYMDNKNGLGQLASAAFIFALYEIFRSGGRRVLGIFIAGVAFALLLFSQSKTSAGLAILVPVAAFLILGISMVLRISPAILLFSIPVAFIVFSALTGFSIYRLSYYISGEPTFTSRTIIWEFARNQIAERPLFGWGYQSFWLVGADGPSLSAPGWVKGMPNAHSGYLDNMLELGYMGFVVLLTFIAATVHAIGRVAARDPSRAWFLLSLAMLVIITNFLETLWMRSFEMLWVVFLFVVAEAARSLQPVPVAEPEHRGKIGQPVDRPVLGRAELAKLEWAKRCSAAALRTSSLSPRNNQLQRSRVG